MRTEISENIFIAKGSNRLNLVGMNISDEEVLDIINSIKENKVNLVSIALDKNQIRDEGAIILGQHLTHFKTLTQLSIQFNRIGKEGAIMLFGLKKVLPDLDILFHGNQIKNVSEMEEIKKIAIEITGGMQRRL
jgi:hypothetical protein